MSVWLWIPLGILGVLAMSLFVGLLMAAILANIGRESAELIEFELLESPPPTDSGDLALATVSERRVGGRSSSVLLE